VLVAAAVCPHPPVLVPELAAGAAAELDGLRAACDTAVASLLEVEADLLLVVGDAAAVGPVAADAWGSFAPYGVDVPVGAGAGPPTLPLSLLVGRWLLERQRRDLPPLLLFGVSADVDAERAAHLGATLAEREPRVALLAMGDASGRRTPKPGYLDERAEPYDEAVAAALRDGDPDALLRIDPALSAELLAQGRATWQVLAGAATGRDWVGDLTYADAPYGVCYLVATWRRADPPDESAEPEAT